MGLWGTLKTKLSHDETSKLVIIQSPIFILDYPRLSAWDLFDSTSICTGAILSKPNSTQILRKAICPCAVGCTLLVPLAPHNCERIEQQYLGLEMCIGCSRQMCERRCLRVPFLGCLKGNQNKPAYPKCWGVIPHSLHPIFPFPGVGQRAGRLKILGKLRLDKYHPYLWLRRI